MIRRPPRSTRTDTLFPYTTLFRSTLFHLDALGGIEDFRIDDDDRLRRALVFAAIHHRQSQRNADLRRGRSEEHTSELQSLMRISYAVFCLKKKTSTVCSKIKAIASTAHISDIHNMSTPDNRS